MKAPPAPRVMMMIKLLKKILPILIITCCMTGMKLHAQNNDLELRQQLALKYNIDKRWSVAVKYFLQTNDNMIGFDKSVPGAEIKYKPLSWLKAEVEYRFETNYRKDQHEFRYSLTFDRDIINKKWKVKYRPMLQQQFEYLQQEYLAANPVEYAVRNMLELDYTYNKRTELYAFTEFYTDYDRGAWYHATQKSGAGINYERKKRHDFNLEANWFYDREDDQHALRISVGYSYTLGYVKRKKKKKAKTETVQDIPADTGQ